MKTISEKLKKQLYEIAVKNMVTLEGRGDLEYHGYDDADFVDVSVGSIEAALYMAFELGKKSAKK